MFRPGDIIIYSLLALFIAGPFLLKNPQPEDPKIRISANDRVFYAEAGKDSVYVIKSGSDSAEIEVKDSMVRIKNSTCRDKYCVKKGWLKKTDRGDIICMPNRIIVSFEGVSEGGIDAVTE
ncbi:MAG: NusG domain II-containing protein [Candidatus Delongbacteria bacterium]